MEFYTCIHLCAVEYVHLKYTKLSLHYACVHNSPLKKKKRPGGAKGENKKKKGMNTEWVLARVGHAAGSSHRHSIQYLDKHNEVSHVIPTIRMRDEVQSGYHLSVVIQLETI